MAALQKFRFRVDAAIEDGKPTVEVWGRGAAVAPDQSRVWLPGRLGAEKDGLVASLPLGALPRFVVSGPSAAALESAGARPAGTIASTTVRIEAGEPVMGVDVDEGTIPQETGLTDASVSFTKGCYLGQELVARIDSRAGSTATSGV